MDQLDCVPGSQTEFSVSCARPSLKYQWYFNDGPIDLQNQEYDGTTTKCLVILESLSKHQGSYQCVITYGPKKTTSSKSAILKLGMSYL